MNIEEAYQILRSNIFKTENGIVYRFINNTINVNGKPAYQFTLKEENGKLYINGLRNNDDLLLNITQTKYSISLVIQPKIEGDRGFKIISMFSDLS